MNNTPKCWVNVYELDRGYGGPEEGGWWYDIGNLRQSSPCSSREQAEVVAAKLKLAWHDEPGADLSSIGYRGGVFDVLIEDEPGRSYPEEKPHYE